MKQIEGNVFSGENKLELSIRLFFYEAIDGKKAKIRKREHLKDSRSGCFVL